MSMPLTRDHSARRLALYLPHLVPDLRCDAHAFEEVGEIDAARPGGVDQRFRREHRALERIGRGDVRTRGCRADRNPDARAREREALGDDAGLHEFGERGVGKYDHIGRLAAFQAVHHLHARHPGIRHPVAAGALEVGQQLEIGFPECC
jgi:hypothetical protein